MQVDNIDNKNNQLVVYDQNQNPKPLVAFNEELVHGALSWTAKLQHHMASQLGTEIFQMTDVPPGLKSLFGFMDTMFSHIFEDFQQDASDEARHIVQTLVDQERAKEVKKLTFAGVKNRDQLQHKQKQVGKLMEAAKTQYLNNPCNIQTQLDIDLALVKLRNGKISEDNRDILENYWAHVRNNPDLHKETTSTFIASMIMTMMSFTQNIDDELKQKSDVHPIHRAYASYQQAYDKLQTELLTKRDLCDSLEESLSYQYVMLKIDTMYSPLIWEMLKVNFESKIVRSEDHLKRMTEFFRGVSKSNIDLFNTLIEGEQKTILSDLKSLKRHQTSMIKDLDIFAENMIDAQHIPLNKYYRLIIATFTCVQNMQKDMEELYEFFDSDLNKIKEYETFIIKEKAKTEDEFRAKALESLHYEGILDPVAARQIFASLPASNQTIARAAMIAHPELLGLTDRSSVPLIEEMNGALEMTVDSFVRLYEERDQRIVSLLGLAKVEEIVE